jgi:hypothetical protein
MNTGNRDIQVRFKVKFQTGRRGRRRMNTKRGVEEAETVIPAGRLPRVTRLMALAIRFDDLIQRCEVRDYAEIARLGHITRARVTQIMNLLHLAPDIQSQILELDARSAGRDAISERSLRAVASYIDWRTQRRAWRSWPRPSRSR